MLKRSLAVALVSGLLSSVTFAGECDVAIEATASMAFSTKEISVPKKCKEVSLTLKNSGTMAKNVMGHNVVIAKTADMKGVLDDGSAAGLDANYVKKDDARVVAHTKVIGGGESDTVKFKLDKVKAGEDYSFFCSFPGHSMMMKGAFKVQ